MVQRTPSSSNLFASVTYTAKAFSAGATLTPEESAYEGLKYLSKNINKLASKILSGLKAGIREIGRAVNIVSEDIAHAFSLWNQGGGRYPSGADERSLLERIRNPQDLTTYYDD